MSQPLTFSDDEDTLRFSKQLQEQDISHLMADMPVIDAVAANKENTAWRINHRTKDESPSPTGSMTFHPSPVKTPGSGKTPFKDSPASGNNNINAAGFNGVHAAKKEEDDEWEDKWDVKKTPGSTVSKRKRMLRKIKIEMAAEAERSVTRNSDPDFVFIGDDEDITPTPFRLRSSKRSSRISYRNLDWSTEENDRKRNRLSDLLIDVSEEEREMAAAAEAEREQEERRRRMKRRRKRQRERGGSVASTTLSSTVLETAFSISDDDTLATIAKRARVEEEEEGQEESTPTVLETAFSISDDEALAKIAKRTKKKTVKEEVEEEKSTSAALETAFSISDDEALATIAKKKKVKVEVMEEQEESPPTAVETAFSISDDDSLATSVKKKKVKVEVMEEEKEESAPTVLETAFSISDDEALATVAKRTKKIQIEQPAVMKIKQEPREEQEEEGEARSTSTVLETALSIPGDAALATVANKTSKNINQEPRAIKIKREPRDEEQEEGEAKSTSTVLETALSIPDDEALAAMANKTSERIEKTIEIKREPREEQENEGEAKSASTVLETAFSISDDESLSDIAKRISKEQQKVDVKKEVEDDQRSSEY